VTSQDYVIHINDPRNTTDFIDHPLPKDSVSAHAASHHAWAPVPHHLNPALDLDLYFAYVLFCLKFTIHAPYQWRAEVS